MSPLMNTIVNGAMNMVEIPVTIATTLAAIAVRSAEHDERKAKPGPVDARTMKDIGIERGSITWIR